MITVNYLMILTLSSLTSSHYTLIIDQCIMSDYRQAITVGSSKLAMDDSVMSVKEVERDIITSITTLMLK